MRTAIAIACVAVLAGLASADPAKPWADGVPPETQAKAEALFDAANALFTEQKFVPAIDTYREALALWDHPLIHFDLAAALIEDDRMLEAADELDRALRFGKAPFPPATYHEVLVDKAIVARSVGRIAASCTDPGAHVLLDGKPWFDCPGQRSERARIGVHAVVGERAGFLTSSQRVFVEGGKTTTVPVSLVSLESAVQLEYPWPRWLPWTVAGSGTAVALAGLAVWLGGRSQMDRFRTQLQEQCPSGCDLSHEPALVSERDGAERAGTIGIALEIGGGALLVAGVVAVIANRPHRVLPHLEVAPVTGGIAATTSWRF